jgi:hypothetical protein
MISIFKPGRWAVARVVSSSIRWLGKDLLHLDANPKTQTPERSRVSVGGSQWAWNYDLIAAFVPCIPSRMEDFMCWEMDYKLFDELKRAQEARIKQQQRGEVITKLLNEANKESEKTGVAETPVKEVAPAK